MSGARYGGERVTDVFFVLFFFFLMSPTNPHPADSGRKSGLSIAFSETIQQLCLDRAEIERGPPLPLPYLPLRAVSLRRVSANYPEIVRPKKPP